MAKRKAEMKAVTKKKDDKRPSFRVSPEGLEFLNNYAASQHQDVSKLVRAALDFYFKSRNISWPDEAKPVS